MTIDTIKELLSNKLKNLETQLNSATLSGNISDVISIQNDIQETKNTLDSLNSL